MSDLSNIIETTVTSTSASSTATDDSKRCIMLCSAGKRCNRTKCKISDYCGTHQKQINSNKDYIELIGINYKGIIYYVDQLNNVYDTELVLLNKTMVVIGKYENNNIVLNNA